MNTYNENLQQTVGDTLKALSTQQAKIVSAQITAQHNVYFAQGAEITAFDKLTHTEKNAHFYQKVNDQGVLNNNQANNILASATQANTNVVSTVSNISTAAANVQIASNAIAMLASDIGAALNIATASLYGTDSFKKIKDANSFINEVANDAKNASLLSMDASSKVSEIIAGSVLNQSTTVKTKIDNLLKVTQTEFNNFAAQAIAENQAVADARKAERQAEGVLKDADKEVIAITQAYANANDQLNLGLSVTVQSSKSINVNFTALSNPLPAFSAHPAMDVSIPAADPAYYLAIVPADKQTLFSPDQAEQLFAQAPTNNGQFISVNVPTPATPTSIDLTTNKVDVYNNALLAGNSYVVFLYIELSNDYKRFVGNFSDILSVASQVFTLTDSLPAAQKLTLATSEIASTQHENVQFTLKDLCDNPIRVPLKICCILVKFDELPPLNLMRSNDFSGVPIYFNLEIAEQVSPANYTAISVSPDNPPKIFTIKIPVDATDNFGNPIEPGVSYKPYILTTVDGDLNVSSAFTNTLSGDLDPQVIFPNTDASVNVTTAGVTTPVSTSETDND